MSGMAVYFTRRLMLVPITFLVITFMVYAILRVVPGGPIEQAETQLKMAQMSGEGGGGGGRSESRDNRPSRFSGEVCRSSCGSRRSR